MTTAGTSDETLRHAILVEARLWIGTPYRHQASLRGVGCDCLGFVRGIWRTIYGAEPEVMPGYSSDWAEADGQETLMQAAGRHMQPVAITDRQPGDLLLFRWRKNLPAKHVGILMPDERLLHAYDAAGGVVEGALVPAWRDRIAAVFAFPPLPEDTL